MTSVSCSMYVVSCSFSCPFLNILTVNTVVKRRAHARGSNLARCLPIFLAKLRRKKMPLSRKISERNRNVHRNFLKEIEVGKRNSRDPLNTKFIQVRVSYWFTILLLDLPKTIYGFKTPWLTSLCGCNSCEITWLAISNTRKKTSYFFTCVVTAFLRAGNPCKTPQFIWWNLVLTAWKRATCDYNVYTCAWWVTGNRIVKIWNIDQLTHQKEQKFIETFYSVQLMRELARSKIIDTCSQNREYNPFIVFLHTMIFLH